MNITPLIFYQTISVINAFNHFVFWPFKFITYRHFIHLSIYMEESGPEMMGDIIAPFIKSSLGSALFLDQCGPAACCKAVKRKALVAPCIHQSAKIWKRILRDAILQ